MKKKKALHPATAEEQEKIEKAIQKKNSYQKSVIMKYIDNLLDWADSLFNRSKNAENQKK